MADEAKAAAAIPLFGLLLLVAIDAVLARPWLMALIAVLSLGAVGLAIAAGDSAD